MTGPTGKDPTKRNPVIVHACKHHAALSVGATDGFQFSDQFGHTLCRIQ